MNPTFELATALDGLEAGITICDTNFKVVYMNDMAAAAFSPPGSADPGKFLGMDLRTCHKPSSNETMRRILETGKPNIYTVKKRGVKKLIFQAPWTDKEGPGGLVEISIRLPENMPHHDRDNPAS